MLEYSMINKEIQKKLREKYNPDGSDLRIAQLRMCEMLKFIDKICKENNLIYWLDSGTLLGAARHKGFIPWDDDTDICMPLNEVRKLKQIFQEKYQDSDFVLHCHETDSMYMNGWIVLRDLYSEYIQESNLHNIRKYKGLQIDIFPVEDNTVGIFHYVCAGFQSVFINRLLFSNYRLLHIIASAFYRILYKIIIPIFRFFKNKSCFYRMSYGCTFRTKRYLSTIYPLSQIEFEGYMFNAPCDVDKYLNNIYKDWKTIPSEDKIETHDVSFKFYFK